MGGWVGGGERDATFKSNSSAFFALKGYPLSFNDETIIITISYIALYPVQTSSRRLTLSSKTT